MISWFSTIMLCICVFAISTNIAGYVFVPEKHPVNKLEIIGWLAFTATVIIFEVARK